MKKLISVIILLLFVSGCGNKEKNYEIKNDEQLVQATETYYLEKNKDALYAIADYLSERQLLSDKDYVLLYQGFFMGVLHDNSQVYGELFERDNAMSVINVLKTAKQFSYDMESILDGTQRYYPENTEFLDTMWGYFYATGDERVINKLCYIRDFDYSQNIRSIAQGSLEANREKYPDKVKACK